MAKLVLTDKSFKDEVLDFKGVVLVDFWAEWCMPCQILGPIIEELAEEMKDTADLKIAKMDVDSNQETSMKYQIMSIPTILIFKDGQVVDTLIGVRPKDSYVDAISNAKK